MRATMRRRGFSLIEVIMATAVIAAAFTGLAYTLANVTMQSSVTENINTAVLLAHETMEVQTAKPFADIASVGQTSYGGNFSRYRYQVAVDYVAAADLNTPIVAPSDCTTQASVCYKRITVSVTKIGWTGNVQLRNIKSNA